MARWALLGVAVALWATEPETDAEGWIDNEVAALVASVGEAVGEGAEVYDTEVGQWSWIHPEKQLSSPRQFWMQLWVVSTKKRVNGLGDGSILC